MNYHPSFDIRVRDLLRAGVPVAEIARCIGVALTTLKDWREKYPAFEEAWKEGTVYADARVANSVFKRAVGYSYTKTKTEMNADGDVVKTIEEEIEVPPDVGACVFWLKNRRPDEWQDKVEHDVTPDAKKLIDTLSEVEQARRIAFALAKAMHAGIEDKTRTFDHGDTTDQPRPKPEDLL